MWRPGQGERDEDASPRTDPQLVSFTDRFLDEEGRAVPFWWQAARIDEFLSPDLRHFELTDGFETPAAQLDFVYSQGFNLFDQRFVFRFKARNLLDQDVEVAHPYFVMELCEGGSLRERLDAWRETPVTTLLLMNHDPAALRTVAELVLG